MADVTREQNQNVIHEAVADRYDVFESAEDSMAEIDWAQGRPTPASLREAAMWFLLLADEIEARS